MNPFFWQSPDDGQVAPGLSTTIGYNVGMTSQKTNKRIPVVDIFAGPGGLGEGFARFPYTQPSEPKYQIRLSVEKDERAHQTLRLRSFKRQFNEKQLPASYYRLLKDVSRQLPERLIELFDGHPEASEIAHAESMCAELGNPKFQTAVDVALDQAVGDEKHWVLLGGPPCQAYSLVGRSRNRGNAEYVPSKDKRQFLYLEYLKVIAEHLPSVFIMENVKGLLSATVKNERIFEQIIGDLQEPRKSIEISKRKPRGIKDSYQLFSLELKDLFGGTELSDFIIRMENFGVPQARHRLIILGIRDDLCVSSLPSFLARKDPISANDVLVDLPRLRSGLSKESDNEDSWKKRVAESVQSDWFKGLNNGHADVKRLIRETVSELKHDSLGRGSDWMKCKVKSQYLQRWFHDGKIGGVFNHETRGHIAEDLHRYLYAACHTIAAGTSPSLKDFPFELLPNHQNVNKALEGSLFADRFRVQAGDRPSTTITSHISKDGHYYIHPDPSQCRSLTVREAARLQTFPDNYFFCGPRTSQYTQVGNAVPPYIAHQIADIVNAIFSETGVT